MIRHDEFEIEIFCFCLFFLLEQINKPASPKHAPVSPASTIEKLVQQPKQQVKPQGKPIALTIGKLVPFI